MINNLTAGIVSNLPVYPVILPFITAIILLLIKSVPAQRKVAGISGVLQFSLAAYLFYYTFSSGKMLVFCASNWSPPFGIVLVLDIFSTIMVLSASLLSLMCLFFSFRSIDYGRERYCYYALWNFLVMGINGSFVTGDLFNLYVFFEIMLMSSYILLVLGSEKPQLREGFKYLIINIFSSTLFLLALGLLYAMIGSMNMADVAAKIAQIPNQHLVMIVAMLFFIVFSIKGALFPLYFWLPQSYCTPPAPVAAFFGGALTKVGVYCMIRVFTLIFIGNTAFTHHLLLIIAAFTMFFGVFNTISRMDYKSILSYHIISQIGYMIMGLGLFSVWSVAAAIFYTIHNMMVKSCLFLTQGITEKITGTRKLNEMGGLLNHYPVLGWTFLTAGLALAGIPPLSGFFGKFLLLREAFIKGEYWIMAVAIIVSFLTLFSMTKIFIYVFWGKEKPLPQQQPGFNYLRLLPPCFVLIAVSIFFGLGAQPVLTVFHEAAAQIMDPSFYIQSVLSVSGGR